MEQFTTIVIKFGWDSNQITAEFFIITGFDSFENLLWYPISATTQPTTF